MSAEPFCFAGLSALGYLLLKEAVKGSALAGMRHISPSCSESSTAGAMVKAIACQVLGAAAVAVAGFILGRS